MWIIKNRIKNPSDFSKPMTYNDDEWFHIITIPRKQGKTVVKINKNTKNMFVITPSGHSNDHAFKLTDEQFDRFEELIDNLKKDKK
jgi:hypothetical protein